MKTVAVVMGGPSGEHEISLKSGRGIVQALLKRRFFVESVVIPRSLTVLDACSWTRDALGDINPDVVFIALHGTFGEDGTIQKLCEELHLDYTGSDPVASRLGMDKVASRRIFEKAGLAVPRWQTIDIAHAQSVPDRLKGCSYPLVVKPISEGSSLGVSIVGNERELPQAISEAARYGGSALIEDFVSGRELTVGILDYEPLPVVEIKPNQGFFDFKAKYTSGSTSYIVPACLSEGITHSVQRAALSAHRALGCRHLSRADIILTEKNIPVLLEVNTIPGFTATSLLPKAAANIGISYEDLCERLVMMACASECKVGEDTLQAGLRFASHGHS